MLSTSLQLSTFNLITIINTPNAHITAKIHFNVRRRVEGTTFHLSPINRMPLRRAASVITLLCESLL